MTNPPDYQPPFPAPQPSGPPPVSERAWYQKKRFVIPLGVVVVLVVAGIFGGSDDDAEVTVADVPATSQPAAKAPAKKKAAQVEAETTAAKPKPKVIGLGTKVRDGKFEFVVKSISRRSSIGSEYLNEKAQGKFLLVKIKVTNIGDEAQTFFGSNQKLIDAKGREFSADDGAAIYLDTSNSFIEEINPGNSLTGVVVFDVPKNVSPAKIELHDSAFSGGKTVKLS